MSFPVKGLDEFSWMSFPGHELDRITETVVLIQNQIHSFITSTNIKTFSWCQIFQAIN